jgi:hypothetical protein
MEHRGVEYRIMQDIKPGDWKWSVETETGTKAGRSDRRDAAVIAANRDRAWQRNRDDARRGSRDREEGAAE